MNAIIAICLVWFSLLSCSPGREQEPKEESSTVMKVGALIEHEELKKPTSVIRFRDHYVATELKTNKLAIFDDFLLENLRHFDPVTIGEKFQAPHFLALSPQGNLLISNGWGRSIVEIENLEGAGWKEFRGDTLGFKAPHGICVDDQGWIYVGDSLHSRLVRFKDMDGTGWQVFEDIDKKISYSRQLVCKNGAVWISNSYEAREGLNSGQGSNVLRIDDFESGKANIVYETIHTNITGILPLDRTLLVAEWGNKQSIISVNMSTGELSDISGSKNALGIPYGLYENKNEQVIAAYFGSFQDNQGGLAVLENDSL